MVYGSGLLIFGPEWDRREVKLNMTKDEIGIFVSGGIDSAVLLRLMLSQSRKRHFHIFTIDNQRDNALEHARNCISCAQDMYSQYDNTVSHTELPPTHPLKVDQIVLQTAVLHRAIPIYTATNHIPPVEWFELSGVAPWRPWRLDQKKIRTPFLFLYKYHILSIIEEMEWYDILEHSHTCTEDPIGHCGECWQCNELKWAKNQLERGPHVNGNVR